MCQESRWCFWLCQKADRDGHDDLGAAGGAAAGRADITRTRSLGLVTAVVTHWRRVVVFERLSRS